MKKSIVSALSATAYLLAYLVAFNFNAPLIVLLTMFLFAPFVVFWMVVSILKDNSVEIADLNDDEEYGYQDKPKSELGTF